MTTIKQMLPTIHAAGHPLAGVLVAWMILSAQPAGADALRTQTLALEEGWNAVYLSVDPLETHPAAVFAGTPVDIVASYDGSTLARQFASNPSANLMAELGWGVWYAPSRDDNFLSTLAAIRGPQAYLLHATEAATMALRGAVSAEPMVWGPDAYNFAGYTLHPTAPPTFAQFFNPSEAHQGQAIYRLVNGAWKKVQNPATEPMRSGEAFWVYCSGSSTYQGPLEVKTSTRFGVLLESVSDDVVLANRADHPIQVQLAHEPPPDGGMSLSILIKAVGGEEDPLKSMAVAKGAGAWTQDLPPLEGGASVRVPLWADPQLLPAGEVNTLICLRTDLGTETWLPVTGYREDEP